MAVDPFSCLNSWAHQVHQAKASWPASEGSPRIKVSVLKPNGEISFTVGHQERTVGEAIREGFHEVVGTFTEEHAPYDPGSLARVYQQVIGSLRTMTDAERQKSVHSLVAQHGSLWNMYKRALYLHHVLLQAGCGNPRDPTLADEKRMVDEAFMNAAATKYCHEMKLESVRQRVDLQNQDSEGFRRIQHDVLTRLGLLPREGEPEEPALDAERQHMVEGLKRIDFHLIPFPDEEKDTAEQTVKAETYKKLREVQKEAVRRMGLEVPKGGELHKGEKGAMGRGSAHPPRRVNIHTLGEVLEKDRDLGVQREREHPLKRLVRDVGGTMQKKGAEEAAQALMQGDLGGAALKGALALGGAFAAHVAEGTGDLHLWPDQEHEGEGGPAQ